MTIPAPAPATTAGQTRNSALLSGGAPNRLISTVTGPSSLREYSATVTPSYRTHQPHGHPAASASSFGLFSAPTTAATSNADYPVGGLSRHLTDSTPVLTPHTQAPVGLVAEIHNKDYGINPNNNNRGMFGQQQQQDRLSFHAQTNSNGSKTGSRGKDTNHSSLTPKEDRESTVRQQPLSIGIFSSPGSWGLPQSQQSSSSSRCSELSDPIGGTTVATAAPVTSSSMHAHHETGKIRTSAQQRQTISGSSSSNGGISSNQPLTQQPTGSSSNTTTISSSTVLRTGAGSSIESADLTKWSTLPCDPVYRPDSFKPGCRGACAAPAAYLPKQKGPLHCDRAEADGEMQYEELPCRTRYLRLWAQGVVDWPILEYSELSSSSSSSFSGPGSGHSTINSNNNTRSSTPYLESLCSSVHKSLMNEGSRFAESPDSYSSSATATGHSKDTTPIWTLRLRVGQLCFTLSDVRPEPELLKYAEDSLFCRIWQAISDPLGPGRSAAIAEFPNALTVASVLTDGELPPPSAASPKLLSSWFHADTTHTVRSTTADAALKSLGGDQQ